MHRIRLTAIILFFSTITSTASQAIFDTPAEKAAGIQRMDAKIPRPVYACAFCIYVGFFIGLPIHVGMMLYRRTADWLPEQLDALYLSIFGEDEQNEGMADL